MSFPSWRNQERLEPTTLAPTCRPKEPMTMTQLNEYYDRIVLGNLCVKCDQGFVSEGEEFCPKCSKRPEVNFGGGVLKGNISEYNSMRILNKRHQ